MKFFEATVAPKKSHPESPDALSFYSDKHNTAKGFADEIKALLVEEDENHAFWFNPVVSRITEEEYLRLSAEADEGGDEAPFLEGEAIGGEIAENSDSEKGTNEKSVDSSLGTKIHGDKYYWFQYTKNLPIVIKITASPDEKHTASYKFDSDLFIEIDKQFENPENGIVYALGLVIDDCLDAGTSEHKLVIKGIGNRGEDAIPSALMSDDDVANMFGVPADKDEQESCGGFNACGGCPACKHADSVEPWKENPEIEHQELYAALVDVVTHYRGDKVPSVADCYKNLVNAASELAKDVINERKLAEIVSTISNPNNFTNGASVTQIVMRAHPELDHSVKQYEKLASKRIEEKFEEIDSKSSVSTPYADANEASKALSKEGEEFENTKHDDFVPDSEPLIVGASIDKENITVDECGGIDDSEGMVLCDGRKVYISNLPELKAEFNDSKLPDPNDLFDFGDDKRPDEKEEKSDFEKLVESYNEKINALEPGEVISFDDMPNEVYHACDGISSSQIKDARISLMYFNAKYNTKAIDREESKAFDIGSVFHSICLEPDVTSKEYICEPSGDDVPKKPTDPQIEKYNKWRELGSPEKSENAKAYPTPLMFERCGYWNDFYESCNGLYPVSADDWRTAEAMVESAMNDEDSSRILKHPKRRCEVSYFKRCDTTGLIIKCRPDIELGKIIGDLKSISMRGQPDEKYLISALRKEVYNRDYHLSAAMYMDITGKDRWLWIFTNKQEHYHWTATVRATDKILDEGRDIYLEYKQKIADAYESGIWPKPESIQSKKLNGKTELPEI